MSQTTQDYTLPRYTDREFFEDVHFRVREVTKLETEAKENVLSYQDLKRFFYDVRGLVIARLSQVEA